MSRLAVEGGVESQLGDEAGPLAGRGEVEFVGVVLGIGGDGEDDALRLRQSAGVVHFPEHLSVGASGGIGDLKCGADVELGRVGGAECGAGRPHLRVAAVEVDAEALVHERPAGIGGLLKAPMLAVGVEDEVAGGAVRLRVNVVSNLGERAEDELVGVGVFESAIDDFLMERRDVAGGGIIRAATAGRAGKSADEINRSEERRVGKECCR